MNEMNIKRKKFKKALLTATIIASLILSGCGEDFKVENANDAKKQEALLNDTIFDRAITAQIQDTANYDSYRPTILTLEEHINLDNDIYHDIINDEYISEMRIPLDYRNVRKVSGIVITGSIFEYLTEEDIKKLRNKEFTKDDENRIICQIRDKIATEQEDATNDKTKKLK